MSIAPTFHKMEVWLWLQGISAGQKPLPCMCLHKSDKFPILSGSSGRPAVCGEKTDKHSMYKTQSRRGLGMRQE